MQLWKYYAALNVVTSTQSSVMSSKPVTGTEGLSRLEGNYQK